MRLYYVYFSFACYAALSNPALHYFAAFVVFCLNVLTSLNPSHVYSCSVCAGFHWRCILPSEGMLIAVRLLCQSEAYILLLCSVPVFVGCSIRFIWITVLLRTVCCLFMLYANSCELCLQFSFGSRYHH